MIVVLNSGCIFIPDADSALLFAQFPAKFHFEHEFPHALEGSASEPTSITLNGDF